MAIEDLSGKVAVVTGGASGIGLALAKRLKADGADVVIADREAPALAIAAKDLDVVGLQADVRDEASLEALADAAIERFGRVDLVCANAGVSRMAAIERLTAQDWRWLFDVNVFGVVNTVRAFLPLLKANPDGGHILITASLSSLYPTRSQGAYASTKYAVAGFAETLALELEAEGARVGVSVLCPGPVRTNIGTSARNRGAEYASNAPAPEGIDIHEKAFRDSVDPRDWSLPDDIAAQGIEGVKAGLFWVITHPRMMAPVLERHRRIEAAAGRTRPPD
jgi:NAD(P)-dependent dehydrogenase (short-subunit alcohol dehydrogenase family)